MAVVRILPQPGGLGSLGGELRECFDDSGWLSFRGAVAFAKMSGVRLIQASLHTFAQRPGRTTELGIGIDEGGTSLEAIQTAWRLVQPAGKVFIYHDPIGKYPPTFHVKAYLFAQRNRARALIGSSNLTRGGLHMNHEMSVALDLDLRDALDRSIFDDLNAALDRYLTPGPSCVGVDTGLLQGLHDSGDLPGEAAQRASRTAARRSRGRPSNGAATPFSAGIRAAAPSEQTEPAGLPPVAVVAAGPPAPTTVAPIVGLSASGTAGAVPVPTQFMIEVVPHPNGEVFLSYIAVRSHPLFFGWPFTGWTTPKRPANPPYPMADPDPIIDLAVVDATGAIAHVRRDHELNTVDYSRNHEIRITLPDGLQRHVPPMSILVMTRSPRAGVDYELRFVSPGSAEHAHLVPTLTLGLPSGGAPRARRYGWR